MTTRYPTEALLGKPLSEREHECLRLMADGMSNAEIGRLLDLSINTVKVHVATLLAKLGAANRTHAVSLGHRRHLLLGTTP